MANEKIPTQRFYDILEKLYTTGYIYCDVDFKTYKYEVYTPPTNEPEDILLDEVDFSE